MFMLSMILGSFLCPNYCYEVNKANVTWSPTNSSPFNINVGETSQNSTHSNGASQNINDNYRPSQTQTITPSQDHIKTVTTTPESIHYSEDFMGRFTNQTTNRPYANPGCSQVNCTSRNGDFNNSPNISMRPEIGGKPVPSFSENPEGSVGDRELLNSSLLSSWGILEESIDSLDSPVKVERDQFLWQVSVFSKEVSPRVRVCGGSLVTSSAVISAAQCFWGVGPLPADQFVVAAGKAASSLDIDDYDAYQHRGDVRDIRLPPRFRGAASSFQDDLAVVVLARPLSPALTPVCVSFDWELDEQQLVDRVGYVMGVEIEEFFGSVARRHRVPHIPVEECLQVAPADQLRHLTSDKICAGFRGVRKPPFCNYDIGSGLAYYPDSSRSIPFLRGVVSLPLGESCVTVFTHVGTHRAFLLRHVSGLETECARHYPGAGGAVKKEGGGGNLFVCNCYC